jgi:hydroxymethylglutaryl-CoA synthase
MTSLAVGAVATAGAIAYTARQRRSSSFNDSSNSSSSRPNGATNGGGGTATKTNGDIGDDDGKCVGILAVETYFPRTYVSQEKLEEHAGVPAGKYRIGLGQDKLAVVSGDAEDINSLCLTVVHALFEKYRIDPSEVGRLEVGTETLVDKSKSTKTVLMSLFGDDNTDVEGATVVNACYGGTAALLNAFHWCESSGWDGRYAVVVAADIATYARGPARPTSGAGAVAVLVGRNAPLAYKPKERATHAAHVWDFFKPDPSVEYPTVDGALSQVCYYRALEDVYERFLAKLPGRPDQRTVETAADYYCFHAPYNKLVQKSFARLFLMDARRQHSSNGKGGADDGDGLEEKKLDHPLQEWVEKEITETYNDKQLEKAVQKISAAAFKHKCGDANYASTQIGNTYTASVFFGLASLVDRLGGTDKLVEGTTIGMFSYGSGALATMYRLHVYVPVLRA